MRTNDPVSIAEATDALQDIAATQERSKQLYGCQMAAPHLILWGAVWVLGYGIPWLFGTPDWTWAALVIPALAGSFWIGKQQTRHAAEAHAGRYLAAMIAVAGFIFALFAVIQPQNDLQVGAVMPLLVAIAYALDGIFHSGARMWLTGLGIGVLTVVGFFWLPQYFLPWMALTGGGGLILGGVWLRSA
ncbi:MAG: hypothetical protein ACRD1C_01970 [Terriglobales bacterium]